MKIALLFPGYGTQHVGMGKELCEKYASARKCFDEASNYLGVDLQELCFTESDKKECVVAPNKEYCFPAGSPRINIISNAYIAIFVVSKCVATILQENGIEIAYMAGYDTGQYTAVHEAGGISFFDSLDLLKIYSELYMDLIHSGKYDMIKINGLTSTLLAKYLDNRTSIAAYQSQTQHLVSGTQEGIKAVRQKLRNASGVTIYDEGLGLGLNSPLMEQVAKQLQRYINKIEFDDLRIPLISNINGKQVLQGAQVKEEILHLITRPIAWNKVVDKLGQADIILGIGHLKANLLDLVREKYSEKRSFGLSCEEDFEKLKVLLSH